MTLIENKLKVFICLSLFRNFNIWLKKTLKTEIRMFVINKYINSIMIVIISEYFSLICIKLVNLDIIITNIDTCSPDTTNK